MINSQEGVFSPRVRDTLYRAIGAIMIISVIVKILLGDVFNFSNEALQGWNYSEMMITLEGGFVRRGILGEIFYWITANTGIAPQYIIFGVSVAAYLFVLWFFFRKFREGGYCWWFILSALMCGMAANIIRRDYLIYIVLIGTLLMLRQGGVTGMKRFWAFVLVIVGLIIHEAFIFWGGPVYAMIVLADRRYRRSALLSIAIIVAFFLLMCVFKGDAVIAQGIVDSWNNVIPGEPLTLIEKNGIGALAWDMKYTVTTHFKQNIGVWQQHSFGLIYWPICYLVIYYFMTFFFRVVKPVKVAFGEREQNVLSSLFMIVTLCMFPLFTLLSCDYGRLYQHAVITVMASYLILGPDYLVKVIPQGVLRRVSSLNDKIYRLVTPSKGLLIILLLIIGVSPSWYNPYYSMTESPIGAIGEGIISLLNPLF